MFATRSILAVALLSCLVVATCRAEEDPFAELHSLSKRQDRQVQALVLQMLRALPMMQRQITTALKQIQTKVMSEIEGLKRCQNTLADDLNVNARTCRRP